VDDPHAETETFRINWFAANGQPLFCHILVFRGYYSLQCPTFISELDFSLNLFATNTVVLLSLLIASNVNEPEFLYIL